MYTYKEIYNEFVVGHVKSDSLIWNTTIFPNFTLNNFDYLPVVHNTQFSYIELPNCIYFNPPPIFIPTPSILIIIILSLTVIFNRNRRTTCIQ